MPPRREPSDDPIDEPPAPAHQRSTKFPPPRGRYNGRVSAWGARHHWRIVTTESNAPVAPAASLLFQAPVFQAAPEVASPAAFEEPETKPKRRRASSDDEASASQEETAPKRRRRSKKSVDEASNAAEDSTPSTDTEETPSEPKTRRRRRSKKADEASAATEDSAEQTDAPSGEPEGGDEEESSSRRRRRRRARSTASSDEGGDPADQVQALKGSTRLEAKKMRRREGRREGRRRHSISESEFLARRESVERTMVIRDQDGLDQIAILEDGLLVEHYVARRTQSSMVGNIYLGRVQNVLPSMEAAFVDVGRGRTAVLYAGEVNWDAVGLEGKPRRIESALKSGDPVLVQVTKDPIGHKGARLTSQITLAGRYLVLIPGGSMMGISRKLPDKERARLKKILKAVVPSGSGVIVRTAAEGATEEQIRDDVARLTRQWEDIEKKRTNTKSAPTLLRGEPELAVRVVRDIFNEDFSKLIIEGRDTYATVKEYVDELSPELSDRVEQWVGTEDVFHAHRIDEQLAKGMDRKVWLPSGGTLIIDRTEAMTVIDVNTGKFIGAGGTLEETVTRNNLEAAEEIVRQLRLRDIGGIVIIDFVDMVLESNRDLVLRRLVECLGRDRTRHQVTEITSLGLVQMTRKRVGEGLVEAFSTSCEACEGRGFIVHHHPVETPGAADVDPQPKGRKKKTAAQEPRRIEDGPERDRAREALSAIAAATVHAEDAASENEGTAAEKPAGDSSENSRNEASSGSEDGQKRRARRTRRVAQRSDDAASTVDEAPASDSASSTDRVAKVSGGDEAQNSAEATASPSASAEEAAREGGADTARDARTNARGGRSSRRRAQDDSDASEAPSAKHDAGEKPAESPEGTPAAGEPQEQPARTSARGKRTRRVATTASQTPPVIDLPAPVSAPVGEAGAANAPVRTVDIELPQRAEGEKAPRQRRTRRVASAPTVTPADAPLSAASVLLGAPGASATSASADAPAEKKTRSSRARTRTVPAVEQVQDEAQGAAVEQLRSDDAKPAGTKNAERKPAQRATRRRRASEEEVTRPPVSVELPQRVSAPEVPAETPREIVLEMPSAEERPAATKRPRRRRVATSESVTPPAES